MEVSSVSQGKGMPYRLAILLGAKRFFGTKPKVEIRASSPLSLKESSQKKTPMQAAMTAQVTNGRNRAGFSSEIGIMDGPDRSPDESYSRAVSIRYSS